MVVTDEEMRQMVAEVHGFFFREHILGEPTRAEQLDKMLTFRRSSRVAWKVFTWLLAGAAAIAGGVAAIEKAGGIVSKWISG